MENFLLALQNINEQIFLFLNQIFGKSHFDQLIIFADKFGGPHVFHYHFLLIIAIATILFFLKKNNKNEIKELFILGITASFTLFFSIIIGLIIAVNSLKYLFSIERPFCSLDNIYIINEVIKDISCSRSFPSGHMSFSIIMVSSFWQLFNKFFKITAIISLIVIGISRIASGAHYPIDLIGSVLICLPITMFIKNNVGGFIRKKEKKFNLFNKIYERIFTQKTR